MSTIAEKKALLPPIDLSSIVFEDEEDDYVWPSTRCSTFSTSCSVASSPVSSSVPSSSEPSSSEPSTSVSSSSSIPSSASSTPSTTKPPPPRKFLEPTDHNTDFFWPMGIRPLELRAPLCLVHQVFVPNNNGIDEIINGPGGQVAPSTGPPIASPKWNWEPQMTMMRHVSTIRRLEPTNHNTDFLWPMGIRPLELRGPLLHEVQAVAPKNNGIYEIVNGQRRKIAPVTRPSKRSSKWEWEPSMTMMRHVWTTKEDAPPTWPLALRFGRGIRLIGVISALVILGFWALA